MKSIDLHLLPTHPVPAGPGTSGSGSRSGGLSDRVRPYACFSLIGFFQRVWGIAFGSFPTSLQPDQTERYTESVYQVARLSFQQLHAVSMQSNYRVTLMFEAVRQRNCVLVDASLNGVARCTRDRMSESILGVTFHLRRFAALS